MIFKVLCNSNDSMIYHVLKVPFPSTQKKCCKRKQELILFKLVYTLTKVGGFGFFGGRWGLVCSFELQGHPTKC